MCAKRSVERFAEIHQDAGAVEALAYLNRGVPHRYTAVYELRRDVLRNVAICDKMGKMRPEFLAEVPFRESFCQFVIRDGPLQTSDSAIDHRFDGHPHQGVMASYHGAPILWRGEIWGTLCHLDLAINTLPDEEFELLKAAAVAWPNATPGDRTAAAPLGRT